MSYHFDLPIITQAVINGSKSNVLIRSRELLTPGPDILTDLTRNWRKNPAWENNEDARLDPDSIAKVRPKSVCIFYRTD